MKNDIAIGLDYSHNNMLSLEAPSYADFTQFLFNSGYKLGKIEAGFSSEKLGNYDVIIISTPKNISLNPKEIETLEDFVRNGGSLLIMGARGGDYLNRTNLNELTRNFGFKFASDEISDSVTYVNLQKRPLLQNFKPHFITEQIKKIVLSNPCSIEVLDFLEEKNIRIEMIVKGGLNCWRNVFDGEEWIEEDCPKIPLMVAVEYFKGKVVAFGTLSILSSLGREYGFSAFDNDLIIANILRWLTTDIEMEGKVITIDLQLDLFHWASSVIRAEDWDNFSDLINASLKYFKDNYNEILKEVEKLKKDKLERKKEHLEAIKKALENQEKPEKELLEVIPERSKEDLEDILGAIEDLTGEKLERTIDFKKEEKMKQGLAKLPEDLNDWTVRELKKFCSEYEIELPSNARKADIIDVIKFVFGIE
ncbi:MAG: hypothetical protein ACFFFB_01515 [Candidatus Heimdallarchaeota archaeon]